MFGNLRVLGLVAACVLVGWSGTATAGAQSACADLGGTVDPARICHVHSATSDYTLDVSFPVDYPDQQALTDYLTRDRDRFVNWVAQNGPNGRGRPYEHVVTAKGYGSGTPASGTQSLVLEIEDDTGAAHQGHPDTSFKAFNYDLGKGVAITFDTLFKPGTNPLAVLNPIVQHQFGMPPSGDPGVDAYRNFAITDDAVTFYFGEDQVIRDNNGPHQISAPRTELASLLA
jgi:hypothetical protein